MSGRVQDGFQDAAGLRSFAAAQRFVAEVSGEARKPGYVLLGDEAFLQDMCRRGAAEALVPEELRGFCLYDLDLAGTAIFDVLDRAQTPSLMAPFQVFFVRNLKALYGRGARKEEFAALQAYARRPNPQALLVFVADHIKLPQDLRAMDITDKERAERIRETLGDWCGVVELQRVSADDAARWAMRRAEARGVPMDESAAHELVDALGVDMLAVANETDKLVLFATAPGSSESAGIGVAEVEQMVAAAKQRNVFELTDALSAKDAPRALALLGGLLNASDGEDAAIGHVFTLAKTFRQMLVLHEKQVRDQRGMWAVLWPGFRVAPFAADALIAQARRYRNRVELVQSLRWIAKADLELRSSPPSKRLVMERLVMRLCGAGKGEEQEWMAAV